MKFLDVFCIYRCFKYYIYSYIHLAECVSVMRSCPREWINYLNQVEILRHMTCFIKLGQKNKNRQKLGYISRIKIYKVRVNNNFWFMISLKIIWFILGAFPSKSQLQLHTVTQIIFRLRRSAKMRNKRHSGTRRSMLDLTSYFSVFLWKLKNTGGQLFNKTLKDIANNCIQPYRITPLKSKSAVMFRIIVILLHFILNL